MGRHLMHEVAMNEVASMVMSQVVGLISKLRLTPTLPHPFESALGSWV